MRCYSDAPNCFRRVVKMIHQANQPVHCTVFHNYPSKQHDIRVDHLISFVHSLAALCCKWQRILCKTKNKSILIANFQISNFFKFRFVFYLKISFNSSTLSSEYLPIFSLGLRKAFAYASGPALT